MLKKVQRSTSLQRVSKALRAHLPFRLTISDATRHLFFMLSLPALIQPPCPTSTEAPTLFLASVLLNLSSLSAFISLDSSPSAYIYPFSLYQPAASHLSEFLGKKFRAMKSSTSASQSLHIAAT